MLIWCVDLHTNDSEVGKQVFLAVHQVFRVDVGGVESSSDIHRRTGVLGVTPLQRSRSNLSITMNRYEMAIELCIAKVFQHF